MVCCSIWLRNVSLVSLHIALKFYHEVNYGYSASRCSRWTSLMRRWCTCLDLTSALSLIGKQDVPNTLRPLGMRFRVLEWHPNLLDQIKTQSHKRKRRFVINPSIFMSWTISSQVDDLVEKIYANMSACHLKNQNWRRAQETADKVKAVRITLVLPIPQDRRL